MIRGTHSQKILLGGGILGVSLLAELARQGHKGLLLLERAKIGGGTSAASLGMLRVFQNDFATSKLCLQTLRHVRRDSQSGFRQNGSLCVLPARLVPNAQEQAAFFCAQDYPMHLLTPQQASERFPAYCFRPTETVLYEPHAGTLAVPSRLKSLTQEALSLGASVVEDVGNVQLKTSGLRVIGVQSARKSWDSDLVVNAAGVWSAAVLGSVGADVDTHCKAIQVDSYSHLPEPFAQMPNLFDYTNLTYGCWTAAETGGAMVHIGRALTQSRPTPTEVEPSPSDRAIALTTLLPRIPSLATAQWRNSRRRWDSYPRGASQHRTNGQVGYVAGFSGLATIAAWGGIGVRVSQGVAEEMARWIQRDQNAKT